jgi:hypothetical protein
VFLVICTLNQVIVSGMRSRAVLDEHSFVIGIWMSFHVLGTGNGRITLRAALKQVNFLTHNSSCSRCIIKTRSARGKTATGHFAKKKTFSRRSRKPPNPCPTLTQRHRSPCETINDLGWALDLCFGVGQTRGFFFNPSLKFAPTGRRTQDLRSATRAT